MLIEVEDESKQLGWMLNKIENFLKKYIIVDTKGSVIKNYLKSELSELHEILDIIATETV